MVEPMLRNVLILLAVATFIGAMMPADVGRSGPERDSSRDGQLIGADDQTETTDSNSAEEPPVPNRSYGSIQLDREADGHFYADVEINGQPVHFVVDTGASAIALTQDDARRAGIFFAPGEFTTIGRGASGDVRGATVAIDRARLGHKTVEGLGGVVLDGGGQSLLGQNFLSRFDSVEIRGDTMTLR